jgi:1-acyl-sn-glycerol-3-phosphate acyltransferase
VSLYNRYKYNFTTKVCKLKPPFIILSTHTGDWDPFFVHMSFRCPLYFVSTDSIYSVPVAGAIIKELVSPIAITKGALDINAIREIISVKNQKAAVCLFPTGSRSFNGSLDKNKPATAKLIRQLKIPLVLYNLEGGYFTTPRWARRARRGKMTGEVAKILSVAEIENLTNEQLLEIIDQNLCYNSYDRQRQKMIRFRGKNSAESLEVVLYTCPECKAVGANKSKGKAMTCLKCGHKTQIDDYGFLHGGKFDNVYDWDEWQKQYLRSLTAADFSDGAPVLQDDGWFLKQKKNGERLYKLSDRSNVTLSLFKDRLTIRGQNTDITVLLADVDAVALQGMRVVQLITSKTVYRLKARKTVSNLLYLRYIEFFKGGGKNEFSI